MDMRDDSASGDGRLDERVQLLVTTDGELQVARRDTLHLQILGRVAGQLEDLNREIRACYQRNIMTSPEFELDNFVFINKCTYNWAYLSSEVLEDGSAVHGGGGTDTAVRGGPVLQVTVDPAHGELKPSTS